MAERRIEATDDRELLRLLLEDVERFRLERALSRAEARERGLGAWTADAAQRGEQRVAFVDEDVGPIEMEEAPDGVEGVQLYLG